MKKQGIFLILIFFASQPVLLAEVNLSLEPVSISVSPGEDFSLQLWGRSDSAQSFDGVDAVLYWDAGLVDLNGHFDDDLPYAWSVSDFLVANPLNGTWDDGDAIYTCLRPLGGEPPQTDLLITTFTFTATQYEGQTVISIPTDGETDVASGGVVVLGTTTGATVTVHSEDGGGGGDNGTGGDADADDDGDGDTDGVDDGESEEDGSENADEGDDSDGDAGENGDAVADQDEGAVADQNGGAVADEDDNADTDGKGDSDASAEEYVDSNYSGVDTGEYGGGDANADANSEGGNDSDDEVEQTQESASQACICICGAGVVEGIAMCFVILCLFAGQTRGGGRWLMLNTRFPGGR